MSPYARLVELAREELQLVAERRFDGLARLEDERRALVAALPEVPPADAREHLLEAERLVQRTMHLCGLALEEAQGHLAQLRSPAASLNFRA